MNFLELFKWKSDISMFKDAYKDQRCFIIGNGPSLNKCDLNLLKDEYTFGVNGIFYKTDENGFVPTFYIVEDRHVIDDNRDKINNYIEKVHYGFFPSIYRYKIKNKNNCFFLNANLDFYNEKSTHYEQPRFSTDCNQQIYCGQSVTYLNLQLAFYMGFSKVYLIGMDFSYTLPQSTIVDGVNYTSTDDDVNHFHPDYFGKGKKWHDPKLNNVFKSYEYAQEYYNKYNKKIYNATIGGKLELFERVDYNSLFKK